MQELETLLNSLIQRGWKPWGIKHFVDVLVSWTTATFSTEKLAISHASFRSLVSLESGLWQFVCSQKLLSDKVDMKDYIEDSYWFPDRPYDKDGFYWVMRCARLEEEELGKFLVDNIKVAWIMD